MRVKAMNINEGFLVILKDYQTERISIALSKGICKSRLQIKEANNIQVSSRV